DVGVQLPARPALDERLPLRYAVRSPLHVAELGPHVDERPAGRLAVDLHRVADQRRGHRRQPVLLPVPQIAGDGEDQREHDRRLLLVHAHPDDEVISTGAAMAKYAADGAHVTLVTCTLGEEGEVLVPELEHLAADKEDRLGEYRITELEEAMKALRVDDHRF